MKLKYLSAVLLSLFLLAGCEKDKGPQGSGEMEKLSPKESVAFIEKTAGSVLSLLNPADQSEIIELAAYYTVNYGNYTLPTSWIEGGLTSRGFNPGNYITSLSMAAEGNIAGITRAAMSITPGMMIERLSGIYTPDEATHSWVKSGDSKDIVFSFSNAAQAPVELRIVRTGDEWIDLSATLTENGAELAQSNIKGNFDERKHSLTADATVSVMNLRGHVDVAGRDSEVKSNTSLFISDKRVADSYATVYGNGLCDPSRWKELSNIENVLLDNLLGKMIKDADCGLDILGEVQVYGQAKYYEQFLLDIAGAYTVAPGGDSREAEEASRKACDRLNKNVKAQLRFNRTKTNQATLLFSPKEKVFELSKEYVAYPMIRFNDGSVYSPEECLAAMSDMAAPLQALIGAYVTIWKESLVKAEMSKTAQ